MSTDNQQLSNTGTGNNFGTGGKTGADGVRLAKRVAQLVPCSRADAEAYIEGGWVQVDGVVIELPQHRVTNEQIVIDAKSDTTPQLPVTLLLHKPSGYDAISGPLPAIELLEPESQSAMDRSNIKVLQQHFAQLISATALENSATGLVVYTKDFKVQRRLIDDANKIECETMVGVAGAIAADVLRQLNRQQVINGQSIMLGKVSISHQNEGNTVTGLRFASKGFNPGQIKQVCDELGIDILTMRRTRIGQVSLKDLPEGQWRYLTPHEKF